MIKFDQESLRRSLYAASRSSSLYLSLLLIPLLWFTYFTAMTREETRAIKTAELRLYNKTQLFEDHVVSVFAGVDRSLVLLRLLYEQDPANFDLKYWAKSAHLLSDSLVKLSLIGPQGYLSQTTATYDSGALYLGDRDGFSDLAGASADDVSISAVQAGRIDGRPLIKIARRLHGPNGIFAGVLSASLDPENIIKFFDKAQLGAMGTVVLRNADYAVLAAEGLTSPVLGKKVMPPQIVEGLQKGTSGFYRGVGAVDGINRLVAYRKSGTLPLILAAGMAEDEIYGDFRRQNTIYLTLATLLSLLLAAVALWDFGRVLRLDQARKALEDSVDRFKSATEHMSQGLSMFDKHHRLVAYNQKYLKTYGLSAEDDYLGCSIKDFLDKCKAAGTLDGETDTHLQNLSQRLAGAGIVTSREYRVRGRTILTTSCRKADGGWVSTHEDVTDRRKAEEELVRVRNFLDTIIQNIPMAILIKAAHSRKILLANRAFGNLHDVDPQEIVGKTIFEIFPAPIARNIDQSDTRAIETESASSEEIAVESISTGQRLLAASRFIVRNAIGKAEYIIVLVDDITERRNNEAKINQLAHYDALTGLANRALFRDRLDEFLARQRRDKSRFAIFMLDLDRFKHVNDTFGHQSGDLLLKAVAKRVRESIREVDIASRLGGDEFAIIVLAGEESLEVGCDKLASRLVKVIGTPFEIDGQAVNVGCSIGIAFPPAHGERSDDLLRNADLALYKAKNSGRNCFYFYSDELKAEASQRSALENDLREAIWREELKVYYQPIISTLDRGICAVEALIRWHHPTRGLIGPNEFIPLAEQTGLIVQLGEWVLSKACHDAKSMPDHVKVAVNVSPVQFLKSNIVDAVIAALVDADLSADRLEVEITEGVVLADSDQNLEALRQLQNLGVSIALDDFGVGYSSLSYLTSFPFDKVKVDRSFVAKIERQDAIAVIKSIVQLAGTLDLVTCAEGVETKAQFDAVHQFGIGLWQGYLGGKPVPIDDLDFDYHFDTGKQHAA